MLILGHKYMIFHVSLNAVVATLLHDSAISFIFKFVSYRQLIFF